MKSSSNVIGVGVVGLSPGRFAASAHLPALATTPELQLRALATSSPESAARASAAFGIPGYGDIDSLVSRDDIDLVVVAVKVPFHREIVLAALAAGKNVLCEWPLGGTLAETEELTSAAVNAGVHAFVGLQARSAPALRHVRSLVADGAIGDVLSTSLIASAGKWGASTDQSSHYLLDESSGASMLMIPFGHACDGIAWTLGGYREVAATCATRRPVAIDAATGESVVVTVADQIAVSGTLESGAVFSLHYRGGMSASTPLLWEINGTDGDIVVCAAGDGWVAGNLQFGNVTVDVGTVSTGLTRIDTPAEFRRAGLDRSHMSNAIAENYHLIADTLLGRPVTAGALPTFNDALVRHRMLDAVTRSSHDGVRVQLHPVP